MTRLLSMAFVNVYWEPNMLGLTRKIGGQVLIGDDVIMEVEWIRNGSVRLVFDAPLSVSIDRPEYVVMKLTEQMDMIGDGL